jgi:hypothetical protein
MGAYGAGSPVRSTRWGVVDEAIEDGVGVARVTDHVVPFGDGQLAGDDGRAPAVAFFQNLEKVVARLLIEGSPQSSRISSWTPLSARSSVNSDRRRGRAPDRRTAWARADRGPNDCRGKPYGRERRRANSCADTRAPGHWPRHGP